VHHLIRKAKQDFNCRGETMKKTSLINTLTMNSTFYDNHTVLTI